MGEAHFQAALDAQTVLKKAMALERIVSLIGESELSADDQVTYKRSKFIKAYMTQSFTVVESQTEKKGSQVALKDTIADVQAILTGVVDHLKPEDMSFIGTLKEIEEKIKAKPIKREDGSEGAEPAADQPPAQQPAQAGA